MEEREKRGRYVVIRGKGGEGKGRRESEEKRGEEKGSPAHFSLPSVAYGCIVQNFTLKSSIAV